MQAIVLVGVEGRTGLQHENAHAPLGEPPGQRGTAAPAPTMTRSKFPVSIKRRNPGSRRVAAGGGWRGLASQRVAVIRGKAPVAQHVEETTGKAAGRLRGHVCQQGLARLVRQRDETRWRLGVEPAEADNESSP